jgi:hypothetical protein
MNCESMIERKFDRQRAAAFFDFLRETIRPEAMMSTTQFRISNRRSPSIAARRVDLVRRISR